MSTRVALNGSVSKPKASPRRKPTAKDDHLHIFCYAVVGSFSIGSAVLNALHGAKTSPVAATLLASLPLVVWTLGQIAARLWKRGGRLDRKLAWAVAVLALVGMALSLIDVVQSIREISGMQWWRATAVGLTLDGGMVVCEMIAALTPYEKKASK